MKTYTIALLTGTLFSLTASGQELTLAGAGLNDLREEIRFAPQDPVQGTETHSEVYKLKPAVDIPVTAVGAIWSGYAFTKIYSKDPIPHETVAALDKNDINAIDRWAAGMSDKRIDDNSDYLFYGSMPLPALLFIDRSIRQDAAKIGFLYLESFAITGLLYTGSTYFTNRFRPETYNTDMPVGDRTGGGNKNSFFAGHVAVVANATFFMAKVYSDYHPDSRFKYVLWGGATAATGTMIYMRHAAGKHFPTDLLVGTAVGTLSGILVPHFHKVKDPNKQVWNISPFMAPGQDGMGLTLTYKIR